MFRNHALYTITEVEFVYYTPDQSGIQTYRIHLKRRKIEVTTSSLSLTFQNDTQVSNTHATF